MATPPLLMEVRQRFESPEVTDLAGSVQQEIRKLLAGSTVKPGQCVAVAVGSRGIAGLPVIVRTIVMELKQAGLKPVIVPAMGSHGGATASGQAEVLQKLGIEAARWGVDVDADMTTEPLGILGCGLPIHFSRAARQVDHLLLCNRIKPHTNFCGPVQSGLQKMLVIGLGKQAGAAACHRVSHGVPFEEIIREAFPLITSQVSVLGGLAIIENAVKGVAHLEAIPDATIPQREPELLRMAERLMPRLPVAAVDLLIIDEIGKEISGTGLDTNVIGRKFSDHHSGPQEWCDTRLIYVRGITAATAGNATGIGIAEFTHPGVVAQVDWQKTAINSITAGHPTAAMCPVVLKNDREVYEAAVSIVGSDAKIVHVCNTLRLERMFVSESYREELLQSGAMVHCGDTLPLEFTQEGWFMHSLAEG